MAVRVLVAEDSATARALLLHILGSDPDVRIVGMAHNGEDAVALTATLRPDVITMDVRMPGIDGFEATRRIMAQTPTPIVIISGHYERKDVDASMNALRAGALTILPKPSGPDSADFADQSAWLLRTVKAMAEVKVVRHRLEQPLARPAAPPVTAATQRARIVTVAASTGGPAALARILTQLSSPFPLPLLVVQHIAAGFAEGLARWLNGVSALPVRVAGERETLRPSTVYVAPDDRHLSVLDDRTITVLHSPAVNGFRPSGSVLFQSAAQVFGRGTVAVILTGMGEDGLSGLRAVRAAGGCIIAQDEASSVVFGMPGAAVEAGLTDVILPVASIAARLEELTA